MKRVFIAGHLGMVGSSIERNLRSNSNIQLILKTREELDLTNQAAVNEFFSSHEIDEVYVAAAKVGGIHANSTYPADFIRDNLQIQTNLIEAAHKADIDKLLLLGSSCIYPKIAPQPIKEEYLLTGALEPTNEAYAIAKIAGIQLCKAYSQQYNRDYRALMPTNLYGPNDNYHPNNSHVIPGLLRRFHEAKLAGEKVVDAWGSGTPRREFLYVDDLAAAAVHVMGLSRNEFLNATDHGNVFLNVGTGEDCTIAELVGTIIETVGYAGEVHWDRDKPDGTPRKLLDVGRMHALGWQHQTSLGDGLEKTYSDFLDSEKH